MTSNSLPSKLLLPLILLSALLAILAQSGVGVPPALTFIAKPLTTILVIAFAWPRGRATTPLPRRWVLIGLAFSLVGDIALLWPDKGFLIGLLSFLAAHLSYLWAFTRVRKLADWPWPFLAYGLLAAAILSQLWPGVPAALRAPGGVYVICRSALGAQAAGLGWRARGTANSSRGALLALGGLLFVISDALLATNKFAGPLPLASLWVLSTYWAAQCCIAGWLARPERSDLA